ncbi:hypothetical protein [Tautonia marina]|uniref:hypothetical protein n=1 Tax=Tautonia marina TaxID=2653855 RepID=UPI001260793C|nr:hypothetical protein [Tautonia marina]
MSNHISSIVVGLGVAVSALPIVAVAGPPPVPSAAQSVSDDGLPADLAPAEGSLAAPPSSLASPEGEATAPSRTVLLMKDGNVKIFDGPATEDRLDHIITLDIGQIRIPKAEVEQRLGSLREAYEYQRDHLPDRDPDENLRLARWCLTHGMQAEAAEQLQALLTWSPDDVTAKNMLRNLSIASRDQGARDSGVVRTGANAGRGGNEPRELDVSVLGQLRAFKGRIPPPVVFDLPEPLAVRRFQEYGQTVHRVLQVRCASCHDETSDRNFRLIRARDPKDLTNAMLVRTNLDATLGLIDRTNPGHSLLLINAIMPHGPDQKAILTNPNSPEYRAMWSWVESLRRDATQTAQAEAPAPDSQLVPTAAPSPAGYPQGYGQGQGQVMQANPGFGGGFATQRSGQVPPQQAPSAAQAPGPYPIPGAPGTTPYPNAINQQIQMDAVHPSAPEDLNFQTVSPLLGSPDSASLMINGRTVQPPSARPTAPAPGTIGPGGAAAIPPPGIVPPGGVMPPNAVGNSGITPPPGFVLPQGVTIPGVNGPGTTTVPPGASRAAPAPGSAPAPGGATPDGTVTTLPDGTQIITQADGSKMMRLPDGELAPIMDKAAINNASGASRGDSSLQIDPALLERLQRRRMGNAP